MSDPNVPDPLPPELGELLAIEHEPDVVPEELRARIRERVEREVAAPNETPRRSQSTTSPLLRMIPTAVVALAAGVAIGRATTPRVSEPTPQPPTVVSVAPSASMPMPSPATTTSATTPSTMSLPPRSLPHPASPVPRASSSTTPHVSSSTDRDASLERTLLERARAALARDDADAALAAVREHETRFASGELTEEREVLAVRALAAAGRLDDARARAVTFRARYPDSVFRTVVDTATK